MNNNIRKLHVNLKELQDVFKSESKLEELRHIAYIADLPSDLQDILKKYSVQNYIPRIL